MKLTKHFCWRLSLEGILHCAVLHAAYWRSVNFLNDNESFNVYILEPGVSTVWGRWKASMAWSNIRTMSLHSFIARVSKMHFSIVPLCRRAVRSYSSLHGHCTIAVDEHHPTMEHIQNEHKACGTLALRLPWLRFQFSRSTSRIHTWPCAYVITRSLRALQFLID